MFSVVTIKARFAATAIVSAVLTAISGCNDVRDSVSTVPPGVRAKIAEADRNGDRQITREEIRQWDELLEARFETADGDENGVLDPEEFDDLVTYRRAARE